jgi:hypothetical protein
MDGLKMPEGLGENDDYGEEGEAEMDEEGEAEEDEEHQIFEDAAQHGEMDLLEAMKK